MPSQEIYPLYNDDGDLIGIGLKVTDKNDNERSIEWEIEDDGTIGEAGKGSNGTKQGRRDPSGGGDHPLGK